MGLLMEAEVQERVANPVLLEAIVPSKSEVVKRRRAS